MKTLLLTMGCQAEKGFSLKLTGKSGVFHITAYIGLYMYKADKHPARLFA